MPPRPRWGARNRCLFLTGEWKFDTIDRYKNFKNGFGSPNGSDDIVIVFALPWHEGIHFHVGQSALLKLMRERRDLAVVLREADGRTVQEGALPEVPAVDEADGGGGGRGHVQVQQLSFELQPLLFDIVDTFHFRSTNSAFRRTASLWRRR